MLIDRLQEAHKELTEHLQLELHEERTRYQNLLTEHVELEAQYADLKSERDDATVRASLTYNEKVQQDKYLLQKTHERKKNVFSFSMTVRHQTGTHQKRLRFQQQRIRVHSLLRVYRV